MENSFTFPSGNIDPKKKDKAYILQYVKAGYNSSRGSMPNSLYFGAKNMETIRAYAQGCQSTDPYKAILFTDDNAEESWRSIKMDIIPILPKFREIAVAKVYQQGIDIQAFAIDELSKSEEDQYFNKMKVKIMMREEADKAGSELLESPVLKAGQNEPEDMEQLQIEKEFGYKHVMAMEAELAIELSHGNSNFTENDKLVVENLVDFGIGGLTQWIDENGIVKERSVDPQRLILSYCNKKDFSDLVYWGEVIEVQLTDLSPYFSREEMEIICNKAKGQWGNPFNYDVTKERYWERFKVYVVDFKFLDWNTTAYEERIDDSENERFGKTKFGKLAHTYVNSSGDIEEGQWASVSEMNEVSTKLGNPKYIASTKKVMYKAKWIIDSDFLYDYGLSENMVRKQSCWWDTGLDVQLYAWNAEKMKFKGLTERLMPLADDVQMTWYNMQNLKNKLLPYILNMDLDSFEGIAFGKGGANMKPHEVVDFLYSNYIALYRSRDKFTNNPNYKPVTVESTGAENFVRQYKDDMMSTIDMMRMVSGLNEVTDSSSPNPKNLNSTNEAAIQGTNNALWPIYQARKSIVLRSADNIVLKQQIAIKLGKVQGMVRAMGTDSMRMYQINPDIGLREFGIFVQDAPTEQQREQLWMEVSSKESQGILDVSDKIMVMSTRNLKQAAMVLAYRIRKRKEEQQSFEMQKIQENNQGQQQMAMMSEQAKQQTIQLQHQATLEEIETQMRWQYQIEAMKKQSDFNAETVQSQARTIGHEIQAQAKIAASHIAAAGSLEKQHIANKSKKA